MESKKMENDQLIELVKKFNILGKGASKELAIQNIFINLRKEVYGSVNGSIVFMEPKAFFVKKIIIKRREERFLWIFMPRIKEEYYVEADINVQIKYVNLENCYVEVIENRKHGIINHLINNGI